MAWLCVRKRQISPPFAVPSHYGAQFSCGELGGRSCRNQDPADPHRLAKACTRHFPVRARCRVHSCSVAMYGKLANVVFTLVTALLLESSVLWYAWRQKKVGQNPLRSCVVRVFVQVTCVQPCTPFLLTCTVQRTGHQSIWSQLVSALCVCKFGNTNVWEVYVVRQYLGVSLPMRENQKRRNIEVLVMSSVLCLISIPPLPSSCTMQHCWSEMSEMNVPS